MTVSIRSLCLTLLAWLPLASNAGCLTDCTPRIGIVSAFGAEAEILVAQAADKYTHVVNGNRFTTGNLRGHRVVIVLSGVSMINATMVTQLMLDHFKVERLVMSGIAGGVSPQRKVGDVTVPHSWVMPMEVYWHADNSTPAPCGKATDVSCLGLELAKDRNGMPLPPYAIAATGGVVPTGLFMRRNYLMNEANAPRGEYRFDYEADARMLAVAREIKPALSRCGPKDAAMCVDSVPQVVVGGRGISGTAFLANAQYRKYLHETLQAEAVDMETAALAHVAAANGVPYIAFRSLSDLAGGDHTAEVGAFFASGLAEANASAVTLAFLEAWKPQPKGAAK